METKFMNLKILTTGLLVAISFSGCIGDRRPGPDTETLHVNIVNNEFCFYIDDFFGIDKYYIYAIDTTDNAWKFRLNTIYDKKVNKDKVDLNTSRLIKLSSIAGEKNCLLYGANMSSDSTYKAHNIDLNKSFWINIYAYKEPYISEESDMVFENTLYFKYDQDTNKTNTRARR